MREKLPRGVRILVSGAAYVKRGNSPEKAKQVLEFSRSFGRELMSGSDEVPVVLINGGRGLEGKSADLELIKGACEVLDAGDLAGRIVTFRDPDLGPKKLRDLFTDTFVVDPQGGTRQARRFEMVQAADAVITISGTVSAQEAVMLALALDRPALPLPFTGAMSAKLWEGRQGERYARRLKIPKDTLKSWETATEDPCADLVPFAKDVVTIVRNAAVLPCFVAMPYEDPEVDELFASVVPPAAHSAGLRIRRSDQSCAPGRILAQMLDQIRTSALMVGILSDGRYLRMGSDGHPDKTTKGVNPNVMYEIGFAHALEIPTILIAQHASDIPFDLKVDRMIEYGGRSHDELFKEREATLREARKRST